MDARRWALLLGSVALGATAVVFLRAEPCVPSAQKLATVAPGLEAFAATWAAQWDQTCSDKTTSEARARRRVCLDGRLSQLAALTEAGADLAGIERLNALAPCNDAIAEVPSGQRAQLALAQQKVARSEAQRRVGNHLVALAAANEAVVLAQYPPMQAQALLARADAERAMGKLAEAEKTLDQAQAAAESGQDFETLARICISHLVVLASQPTRAAQAETWVKHTEDALSNFPQPSQRAELDLAVSVLRLEQGRFADSEAAARRARAAFEGSKQLVRSFDARGLVARSLSAQGKWDDAIAEAQANFEGLRALLGDDQVQTLRSRISLGELLLEANRAEEAVGVLQPLTEKQLAGLPPQVAAAALCCRGKAMTRLRSALGLDDLKRCVALSDVAQAHDALAAGWRLEPDNRRAIEEHKQAIAAFGSQRTAEAASAHASYALTLLTIGDAPGAQAHARTALELFDALPTPTDRCGALWAVAESNVRLKKPNAQTDARAALSCLTDKPRREDELARASFTLATTLGHSPEAIGLLKSAATHPSVQLAALDALAALRKFDSEAACAAAIEALVRAPSGPREKAAKGCKLPRLR